MLLILILIHFLVNCNTSNAFDVDMISKNLEEFKCVNSNIDLCKLQSVWKATNDDYSHIHRFKLKNSYATMVIST